MPWTKVTKPTSTSYTNVNPIGREHYDDTGVTYDSAIVFYDGVNLSAWTKVAKPGGSAIVVGMATGLLMPLTYSAGYGTGSAWTKVNKAT